MMSKTPKRVKVLFIKLMPAALILLIILTYQVGFALYYITTRGIFASGKVGPIELSGAMTINVRPEYGDVGAFSDASVPVALQNNTAGVATAIFIKFLHIYDDVSNKHTFAIAAAAGINYQVKEYVKIKLPDGKHYVAYKTEIKEYKEECKPSVDKVSMTLTLEVYAKNKDEARRKVVEFMREIRDSTGVRISYSILDITSCSEGLYKVTILISNAYVYKLNVRYILSIKYYEYINGRITGSGESAITDAQEVSMRYIH